MWVFTETGFISAVVDVTNDDRLVVRSRDRISLEPLERASGCRIVVGAGTDYPYRVLCPRDVFADWLLESVSGVDYSNFKSRVHDTRGDDFADALMDVWSAMWAVTDSEGVGR